MNIKGYLYLLAIEEHGNISRAAAALAISQPALSKFLSGCEAELSVRLFQREKGGLLIPTEAGRVYLKTAKQIIEIRNRTYASISQMISAPSEVIRVGATGYRGAQTFAKLFAGFYERYPEITLELKEGYMSQLKAWVRSGEVNMALGTLRPEDEMELGFASTSFETLMLAAPLSHPASVRSNDSGTFFPEADVFSFYDAPFVMWGKNTTNYELVRSYFDRLNFHPTVVFESDNALMVDEILKQDAGVGFIPHTFCKAHQNRVYFSTWPPLQTFLGVFFRKDRELSEVERYMIYLMIKGGMIGNMPIGDNAYLNRTSRRIVSEFE